MAIDAHGARENYRLHVLSDRPRLASRLRRRRAWWTTNGRVRLVNWRFNAWAKYDNYALDAKVGEAVARITGLPRDEPKRPDTGDRVVLEGGGIDTDGAGTLLVTEEWLLSDVQVRNPGLTRDGYEQVFRDALGIRQTIWLGEGCVGDDTHGHVDDIARFTAPGVIALAYEADPARRESPPFGRQSRATSPGGFRSRAVSRRDASLPPPGHDEWRTPARELRELLRRERRGDRSYVQRRQRPRRAEHARRALSWPRGRRHPRRGSRLGTRHAALPDAAAAGGRVDRWTGGQVDRWTGDRWTGGQVDG